MALIGKGMRAEILEEFKYSEPTIDFQKEFYKYMLDLSEPEPPFSLLRRRLEAELYVKYEKRIDTAWRRLVKSLKIPYSYLYYDPVKPYPPPHYFSSYLLKDI